MFYSHTFLARKGPLSTVWIAAHLQHRLKKSQYTSTDISSTVQHIMDPGVPIALRMSAFLLLGVVRIYAKKVDYLYHDCNVVRTSFYKDSVRASNTVPEDARQAPFESITMPETFQLDALNLDLDFTDYNGVEDIHRSSIDEITLRDQTPIQMDNYVTISFDEDMILDSSTGFDPMEEDIIIPHSPLTNTVGGQDWDTSIPGESPTARTPPQIFPNPEAIPEAPFHSGPINESPPQACNANDNVIHNPQDLGNENTEPSKDIDDDMIEKDTNIDIGDINPIADEVMFEGSPQRPPTPVTSQGGASDSQVFEGGDSQRLASSPSLQPSPQPQRRGRKRKQFFDDPIVLTNRSMRGALNNPRDILRKRRNVAHSTLGIWKANNSRIKEQIFYRPLLTGLCSDLVDITKREYIRSKPHLVISEEDHADAGFNRTPSPTNQMSNEPRPDTPPPGMEIQQPDLSLNQMSNEPIVATPGILRRLSDAATAIPTIPAQDVGITEGDCSSPNRIDDHVSPTSAENVPASYLATSPGARGPENESASTYYNDTFKNSGFSDTHQLINSPEKEDLDFLLMENNTPASSQGTQGTSKSVGTLTERTRSVAQYLKRHSPILEEPVVSLSNILEGKTRKISARMFFEVLVLKNHGLIDVEQEKTDDDDRIGDVSLKLTPLQNFNTLSSP